MPRRNHNGCRTHPYFRPNNQASGAHCVGQHSNLHTVRSEDQRCAAPGEGRQRLPALVKEWYAEGKIRRDEEKRREDQKEANLDVALKFNALLQKVMEKAPDAEYLAVSAAVMVWIVKGGREEIGSDLMKASAVELTEWEMGINF